MDKRSQLFEQATIVERIILNGIKFLSEPERDWVRAPYQGGYLCVIDTKNLGLIAKIKIGEFPKELGEQTSAQSERLAKLCSMNEKTCIHQSARCEDYTFGIALAQDIFQQKEAVGLISAAIAIHWLLLSDRAFEIRKIKESIQSNTYETWNHVLEICRLSKLDVAKIIEHG